MHGDPTRFPLPLQAWFTLWTTLAFHLMDGIRLANPGHLQFDRPKWISTRPALSAIQPTLNP